MSPRPPLRRVFGYTASALIVGAMVAWGDRPLTWPIALAGVGLVVALIAVVFGALYRKERRRDRTVGSAGAAALGGTLKAFVLPGRFFKDADEAARARGDMSDRTQP